MRVPPLTATERECAQPSPPVNQPEGRMPDVAALRPPCSRPPFCASTPKIYQLPEYNPSPKGHLGRSGGGLVPPWTYPIPIALPKRAIFDHRSLYNSTPSPRERRAERGRSDTLTRVAPLSRTGGIVGRASPACPSIWRLMGRGRHSAAMMVRRRCAPWSRCHRHVGLPVSHLVAFSPQQHLMIPTILHRWARQCSR